MQLFIWTLLFQVKKKIQFCTHQTQLSTSPLVFIRSVSGPGRKGRESSVQRERQSRVITLFVVLIVFGL